MIMSSYFNVFAAKKDLCRYRPKPHFARGVSKLLEGSVYFRDILLIRISRGANNCVQRVFEKNIYFIMIFPPF